MQSCASCVFWTPLGDDRGACARTVVRMGVPEDPTSAAVARTGGAATTAYLETHAPFRCSVWQPDGAHVCAHTPAESNSVPALLDAMRNDLATALDMYASGAPDVVKQHALNATLQRTQDRLRVVQWMNEAAA